MTKSYSEYPRNHHTGERGWGKYKIMIPNDPIMLLSYINTQLRDNYPSLTELCTTLNVDKEEIEKKLEEAGYRYDAEANTFK